MGKKAKPPKAPDYTSLAQQTQASNQQAQTSTDWANRPTQVDMYGNKTSWSATPGIDPATGKTVNQWTQQTQLSPQQQAILNQQQGLQQGMMGQASSMLGAAQSAMSQPIDYSKFQGYGQAPTAGGLNANQYATSGAGQGIMSGLNTGSLGSMPQADDAGRQRIENMLFSRMDPQHQQAQAGLEAKLANMGLTRGSTAWNRELQRLGDQQSRERYDAMNVGGQEQARQFGMQMQGRQQGWNELLGAGQFQNAAQAQGFGQGMAQNAQNFGQQAQAGQQNFSQGMQASEYNNRLRQQQIAEEMQRRQTPLNELNAFMSGQQVRNPAFEQFNASRNVGGVDYLGAGQQGYNAALDSYNAKQAQQQGLMSGLGGLVGTGLQAFSMFSDRRLKRDIERVGVTQGGLPVYTFRYIWSKTKQLGVMADEALQMFPLSVHRHWTGYYVVDYSKVK